MLALLHAIASDVGGSVLTVDDFVDDDAGNILPTTSDHVLGELDLGTVSGEWLLNALSSQPKAELVSNWCARTITTTVRNACMP